MRCSNFDADFGGLVLLAEDTGPPKAGGGFSLEVGRKAFWRVRLRSHGALVKSSGAFKGYCMSP